MRRPVGDELFTIQEKKLSVRDKIEIERDGHTVATVKKALVSPLRDRFSIDVADGEDMEAKGNIVDHEYKIERGGDKAAEVSKRWFRVRDTYGIEIAPGPGRRFDPRGRGLHRPDDARRRLTADVQVSSGRSVRDHSYHDPAWFRPLEPRGATASSPRSERERLWRDTTTTRPPLDAEPHRPPPRR